MLGQGSLLEVSPLGAVPVMWKVGDWLLKGWIPAYPHQGLRQEHWQLWGRWNHLGQIPLSSGGLLDFLSGEGQMHSRHNLLLTARIITYPTVASQLLDISNISSLIKSEGGNTVSFFRGNWGFVWCGLGLRGWMLSRGHHSTGCHPSLSSLGFSLALVS